MADSYWNYCRICGPNGNLRCICFPPKPQGKKDRETRRPGATADEVSKAVE